MTRRECEAKLLKLAEEMRAVYMEYNPAGNLMSVITDGDFVSVDDAFFDKDGNLIRDVHGMVFRTVDVTKSSNGYIKYGSPSREDVA